MSERKPFGELKSEELTKLELRVDDLLRFLGSPGDWGYDTVMADTTIYLQQFRQRMRDEKYSR